MTQKVRIVKEGQTIIKRLENFLSTFNDIVLVFLFGSFARGKLTPFSDLDIAIFFRSSTDFYKVNDLKDNLSKILNMAVDIVILNNAPPVIKMQVLKKGILIINKDTHVYNEFFVNTIKEYDDLKLTRKEIEDNILKGRVYA